MALKLIRRFLHLESAGGVILFMAALLALYLDNSPWAALYQQGLQTTITIRLGSYSFANSLLFCINEGLMTLFFLLVGLELKREFLEGELASLSQAALPAVAALGGMIVPALLFYTMNYSHPDSLGGWSIPVATDIAFSLGVLSLLGKRVPVGLKIFLMALAIFDDVGAILIIAVCHTSALSVWSFFGAILCVLVMVGMNRVGLTRLWPYLLVGLLLWLSVLHSGVHATIAGVVIALLIPHAALSRLESRLHPWVVFFIMPLFALANAGVSFSGISMATVMNPITMGIVAGLLIGKQVGVFGAAWCMIQMGLAKLPQKTTWLQLYGVALLCGIGFTMSLFLGTLAFEELGSLYLMQMRLGVLIGSMLAGIVGVIVLNIAFLERSDRCGLRK